MKTILCSWLAACLLVLPHCLKAQEASPGNRWAAGIGFGYTYWEGIARDQYEGKEVTCIPTEANLEYRLFRWLSLTANFSYGQFRSGRLQIISTAEDIRDRYPFHFSYRLQLATASIGPKVQFRIGQGDLEAELRLGMSRQWLHQESYGPGQRRYAIAYKGLNDEYLAMRAGYTYWPQERFGISVGVEIAEVLGGGGNSPLHEPRTPLPEAFATEPGVSFGMQAGGSYAGMNTLWAGFRYRF